jgi:beta-N-acetylhexosaminidase
MVVVKPILGVVIALAIATSGGGPPAAARTSGSPLAATEAPTTDSASPPTIAELIGQKLVVRMEGLTPSADLLGRIQRGEIGGVILLGANITTASALRGVTSKLRAAAAAGGRPRLIIAVDQEGGPIKRIPWAPPTISPRQMGTIGLSSVALDQGTRTGTALRGLGINVDFAPVADIPASTASFMYRQGRTWSFVVGRTTHLADAFATGLEAGRVAPVMKHFPGLGFATLNTDTSVVRIGASRTALAPGLLPYVRAIAHHIPMIMLSNATYSAYDPNHAAGWSPAIVSTLLRRDLGFTGVTITDSLDGTAHARGVTTRSLALAAVLAGTDMILTTGSESTSRGEFALLVSEARARTIPLATLEASYHRILAFKAGL